MKWQYLRAEYPLHRDVDYEKMDQFLEDRGKEGWELISALEKTLTSPDKNLKNAQQFTFFFKRQR